MALRTLPSRKYWELPEYEFVKEDGKVTYHASRQKRIAEYYLLMRGTAHPGTAYPVKATLERLMDLVRRLDRGLLSDANYSVPELMDFADDRGIEYSQNRTPTKTTLVRLLERADDNAQFSRMLDLPPELRVRIYEHYFANLNCCFEFGQESGCVPLRHTQPPITLASRLLRRESLDVLYGRVALLIEFSHGDLSRLVSPPNLDLEPSRLFAANAVLESFRHVHLCVTGKDRHNHSPDQASRMLDVHIQMPKIDDGPVLVEVSWGRSMARRAKIASRQRHLAEAKSLVQEIAERVAYDDDYEWCAQRFEEIAEVFTWLENAWF